MKKINLKRTKGRTGFSSLLFTMLFVATAFVNVNAQNAPTSIRNVLIERAQPVNKTLYDTLTIQETKIVDGDMIAFDIPGLNEYIQGNKKLIKNIILKIDQVELPEFPAYIESTKSAIVQFRFLKQNLSYSNRVALYKLPGKATKKAIIGIKIDETNVLYYNEPAQIYFKELENWRALGWIVIGAFALFFFFLIIVKKDFITDNVKNLQGDTKDACFSFSKTQLAFWTFIILSSFIYIWASTGDLNSINKTGLILLGITSATIATSNLISTSEETRAQAADKAISKEKGKDITDNVTKLVGFRTHEYGSKCNFLMDILSDGDGLSIHRLQALVFNLVFGIAFIISVFCNYSMPEFSDTQLVLLGLSSGTYAFIKTSENK
jgi:hypothetical protein